ncbi:unnamed protein product, partial [Medioppia subpectinata]
MFLINIYGVYNYEFPVNCGKSHAKGVQIGATIIGGSDALVGEHPWQVIVSAANETNPDARDFCGGTIIDDRWILTASHCVEHIKDVTNYYIRLGVHNRTAREPTEVDIKVNKVILNPGWVGPPIYNNDIALIKLNDAIDFIGKHKHLEPICLATNTTKVTDNCITIGFGYTKTNNTDKAIILQKVNEPLFDSKQCAQVWDGIYNETTEICAGGTPTGGTGVIFGDSGGPLLCEASDGKWYELGVLSFCSAHSATPNIPD